MRGEGGAPGGSHHLHVAAGKAGATIFVLPEHVQPRRPESSAEPPAVLSGPRVPRQLCWPRHGGRTCHVRSTLAVPLRPETQSRVGYSSQVSDSVRPSAARSSLRSSASFASRNSSSCGGGTAVPDSIACA